MNELENEFKSKAKWDEKVNPIVPFEAGLTVTEEHCILSQTFPDLFGLRGTQPQLAIFQQEPSKNKQELKS